MLFFTYDFFMYCACIVFDKVSVDKYFTSVQIKLIIRKDENIKCESKLCSYYLLKLLNDNCVRYSITFCFMRLALFYL